MLILSPAVDTPDPLYPLCPAGGPPSVMSAPDAFNQPGTLPSPDPSLLPQRETGGACTSCGASLRPNAKFCTKCGAKQ